LSGNLKIDPAKLPQHVAIIMDGNGRWAKKRGLPRIFGHKKGVQVVKEIVTECRKIGIKVLTLYAFSTENWNRPKKEVSVLMELLYDYLDNELTTMLSNKISLHAIGDISRLPDWVRKKLEDTIEKTSSNKDMILNLALSYGGRDEIIRAIKRLIIDVDAKKISIDDINQELFSSYLDTAGLPDPDLIIRTSGERRLSNFLLYQAAYSELYITPVLWPDFNKKELMNALSDYAKRERRFGLTSDQLVEKNR